MLVFPHMIMWFEVISLRHDKAAVLKGIWDATALNFQSVVGLS